MGVRCQKLWASGYPLNWGVSDPWKHALPHKYYHRKCGRGVGVAYPTKPKRRLERDTGGVDGVGGQLVEANFIPIPHPTKLALFGHKITLHSIYNTYNAQRIQAIGGRWLILYTCYCSGLKSEQGAEPPWPLTFTTAP